MTLSYNVVPEDLGILAAYEFKHNPQLRRYHLRQLLIGLLVVIANVTLLHLVFGLSHPFVLGGVFLIGWPAFYWWRAPIKHRAYVEQVYLEGDHPGVLCVHHLDAHDTGFSERTAVNTNHYAWRDIPRIVVRPGYTFIYETDVTAFVIPKHGVQAGTYDAFVAAITTWHQDARTPAQ